MKKKTRFKKTRFPNMSNGLYVFLFITCKKPFLKAYSKMAKKDYETMINNLYLVDCIRRTSMYFQEKDAQKRNTLEVRYRFSYTTLEVKFRYLRKFSNNEYELFRNNCVLNTGLTYLGEEHKKGYWHFDLMLNFEPQVKYEATREKVVVGMGVRGFVYWVFSQFPHMLVSGATGQGKTTFVNNLLNSLLKSKFRISVLDGKVVDYVSTKDYFYDYAENTKENRENCIKLLKAFEQRMKMRFQEMKQNGLVSYLDHDTYEPEFLLVDENLIFSDSLEKEEKKLVEQLYKNIVLLGRAAGYFVIFTMQRPDTQFISGIIRSNCMFKIVLGGGDRITYEMMFEEQGRDLQAFEIGKGWYLQGNKPKVIAIPLVEKLEKE